MVTEKNADRRLEHAIETVNASLHDTIRQLRADHLRLFNGLLYALPGKLLDAVHDCLPAFLSAAERTSEAELSNFCERHGAIGIQGNELVVYNPLARIPMPEVSREFFDELGWDAYMTFEQARSAIDLGERRLASLYEQAFRCPSEILTLTWSDIDWEQARLTIHSPKTEHHPEGASRQIPLFPELRPHLVEVSQIARDTSQNVTTRYRKPNSNLRSQLLRILQRAQVKPWPKLFQNMRASRETELAAVHPPHVVCAWLGNSQQVAAKHYLQVTHEDFRRAAADGAAESAATALHAAARVGRGRQRGARAASTRNATITSANGCRELPAAAK